MNCAPIAQNSISDSFILDTLRPIFASIYGSLEISKRLSWGLFGALSLSKALEASLRANLGATLRGFGSKAGKYDGHASK